MCSSFGSRSSSGAFRSGSQKKRASDSRARMTRSLPATIALPPSFASMLATRMKRLASLRRCSRIAQHEAFLVLADGEADHLGRDLEERLVERAHQHDRPFDQPGDLLQQPGVLDQLAALREGEVLGLGLDDRLAPLRVEHDLRLLELPT